jgi:hypothetical protein
LALLALPASLGHQVYREFLEFLEQVVLRALLELVGYQELLALRVLLALLEQLAQ